MLDPKDFSSNFFGWSLTGTVNRYKICTCMSYKVSMSTYITQRVDVFCIKFLIFKSPYLLGVVKIPKSWILNGLLFPIALCVRIKQKNFSFLAVTFHPPLATYIIQRKFKKIRRKISNVSILSKPQPQLKTTSTDVGLDMNKTLQATSKQLGFS